MIRSRRHDPFNRDLGELPETLADKTIDLEEPDDFDPLIRRIGDARIVMLGESTHGTSEFYNWRARLTRRLVEEKGFSFVAVEGDWPPCYRINRFVKDYPGTADEAVDVVGQFDRWPTWMWANWEIVAFANWMRDHNDRIDEPTDRVGFYGLDVYSLFESLSAILEYLEEHNEDQIEAAHRAFDCFEPHGLRGTDYARAISLVGADCRDEVVELLLDLRDREPSFNDDPETDLNLRQNARVAVNAEHYYRTMTRGGPDSWNVRDKHMAGTLDNLLEFHGEDAKAVVWEHNTHIGDARYTDMGSNGLINIGQIGRERYGHDDVVLVGFGTHRGEVVAGRRWGGELEEMILPPALTGTWEDILHQIPGDDHLLLSEDLREISEAYDPRGHRAVGVVYRGDAESRGNYVPTILPRRYDAFVHFDETSALHPLHVEADELVEPDMYPWGV